MQSDPTPRRRAPSPSTLTPPSTAERTALLRPSAGRPPTQRSAPRPSPRPERPRGYAAGHRPGPTDARLAMLMAALASAAAGIIHVAAVPSHWAEWPAAGVFFLLTAVFQLSWSILAMPFEHRLLTLSAIPVNLGLIALWAFSRWQGVPVGPHAGVPEAIGLGDTLSTALEAGIVTCLLWTLIPRESHGVLSTQGYRLAGILASVLLGLMTIPGIVSALSHGGAGHGHGETEDVHEHGETEEEDGHDHGSETEDPATDADEASEPGSDEDSEAPSEAEDHSHAPGEEHD